MSLHTRAVRQRESVSLEVAGFQIPLGRPEVANAVRSERWTSHYISEVEMLATKKVELEAERDQRREEDRAIERKHGPGTAWRLRDLETHLDGIDRAMAHIAEGIARGAARIRAEFMQRKREARHRWQAARRRCVSGIARARRVHRNTRARRVARVVTRTTALSAADPDGGSSDGPNHRDALQLGGESC